MIWFLSRYRTFPLQSCLMHLSIKSYSQHMLHPPWGTVHNSEKCIYLFQRQRLTCTERQTFNQIHSCSKCSSCGQDGPTTGARILFQVSQLDWQELNHLHHHHHHPGYKLASSWSQELTGVKPDYSDMGHKYLNQLIKHLPLNFWNHSFHRSIS